MNKYHFYNLPAEIWNDYPNKSSTLLLECQPYLKYRYYKIATKEAVENFLNFTCEDTGRTQGWFQCFLGVGLYRTTGKIKLSKEVLEFIAKIPTGTVTIEGKTWTEIMESWVQKMNLAK